MSGDTYWWDDDGSRCPGEGCDCPDCRAQRLDERGEDARRFKVWLGTREATLMLRRMVADNQRMEDENGSES